MIVFILQFLTGIFTKLTDAIVDDGLKLAKRIEYLFGLIYGGLILYLMIKFPIIIPLLMGTILAVLLTGKIDHKAHVLGLVIAGFSLYFVDITKINYLLLGVFLVAALLDEFVNNYFDKKDKLNFFQKIFKYRLILELTALLVSIYLNQWIFFYAILSFDVGYIGTTLVTNKL